MENKKIENLKQKINRIKNGESTGRLLPKKISYLINWKRKKNNKMPTIPKGKRPRLGQKPVLTIEELCKFLNIKIPKSYLKYKDKYVSETALFEKVDNKEKLMLEMEIRKEMSAAYYSRFKKAASNFKKYYFETAHLKQTDEEMLKNFLRWWHVFASLGFSAQNYFDYKMYYKTKAEAKKFISRADRIHIHKLCSIDEYRRFFYNKSLFNKTFSEFVHRDYLDMKEASYDEFREFFQKNSKFFAKPMAGQQGQGAEIISVAEDMNKIYEKLKYEHYMIEELVHQHPDIASLNPDTLNTIRIFTLLTIDNEPIIPYAGIRIGRKGYVIDNVSAGGLGAKINIETGKIETEGVDMFRDRYAVHPDTQAAIKDFQIPHWDKVKETVKAAAFVVPQVRYVGWDVAVTDKGTIEIIEGNTQPGFRMTQFIDQIGKKPLYEKHIRALEKANWKKNFNFDVTESDKTIIGTSQKNEEYEYKILEEQVILERYIGKQTHIAIPNEIDGFPVRRLGTRAFSKNKKVREIIVAQSVSSIGKDCFSLCQNLSKIQLPKGLKIISSGLFKGCSSLEEIELPLELQTIYREAFKDCISLKEIELPDSLKVINAEAFKNCKSLQKVILPLKLERICQGSFDTCENLVQIHYNQEKSSDGNNGFPPSLAYIGTDAFKGCNSLQKVKISSAINSKLETIFPENTAINHY